jgi:plastocyanin
MKKRYLIPVVLMFSLICSFSNGQVVHVVTVENFQFSPSTFSATIGDIVRFTWVNGFHTSTSTSVPAGAAPWDQVISSATPTFDYTITATGAYAYKCTPHELMGMVGTFSVTGVTPVKLADFAVKALNQGVRLSWKTLNEENADYFSVEQSYNGIDFEPSGLVKAAGFSAADKTYSFTVEKVPVDRRFVYYRLVTTDKDKKIQYSGVLLYRNPAATAGFIQKVYPNPAMPGGHVMIQFESDKTDKLDMGVFDASGKHLSNIPLQAVEGVNRAHVSMPVLNKGNYYLRFNGNGKSASYPLIVR